MSGNPTNQELALREAAAHARRAGQIGRLRSRAHQLGYRLPVKAWAGIWWRDKLWKQTGLKRGPR